MEERWMYMSDEEMEEEQIALINKHIFLTTKQVELIYM